MLRRSQRSKKVPPGTGKSPTGKSPIVAKKKRQTGKAPVSRKAIPPGERKGSSKLLLSQEGDASTGSLQAPEQAEMNDTSHRLQRSHPTSLPPSMRASRDSHASILSPTNQDVVVPLDLQKCIVQEKLKSPRPLCEQNAKKVERRTVADAIVDMKERAVEQAAPSSKKVATTRTTQQDTQKVAANGGRKRDNVQTPLSTKKVTFIELKDDNSTTTPTARPATALPSGTQFKFEFYDQTVSVSADDVARLSRETADANETIIKYGLMEIAASTKLSNDTALIQPVCFYNSIANGLGNGLASVADKHHRKGINIFESRSLVVPVLDTEAHHYVLCVVMNHALIANRTSKVSVGFPCILYLDGKSMGLVDYSLILEWLNLEYMRVYEKNDRPFDAASMPHSSFPVPQQIDCWSCGYRLMMNVERLAQVLPTTVITKNDFESDFVSMAASFCYTDADVKSFKATLQSKARDRLIESLKKTIQESQGVIRKRATAKVVSTQKERDEATNKKQRKMSPSKEDAWIRKQAISKAGSSQEDRDAMANEAKATMPQTKRTRRARAVGSSPKGSKQCKDAQTRVVFGQVIRQFNNLRNMTELKPTPTCRSPLKIRVALLVYDEINGNNEDEQKYLYRKGEARVYGMASDETSFDLIKDAFAADKVAFCATSKDLMNEFHPNSQHLKVKPSQSYSAIKSNLGANTKANLQPQYDDIFSPVAHKFVHKKLN